MHDNILYINMNLKVKIALLKEIKGAEILYH